MTVSLLNLQPVILSIIPVLVMMLMFALNRKKLWLVRLTLAGMVLMVVFLMLFQYLDYKHFENCLLKGEGYNPFHNICIQFN